ncbi:conserved protein of unknown function [Ectopseudomonas oleovorans]|uniref:Uncharacterized protein n=1 Tax=Ectopseudomonas oleovorans TaxID=301 RepID=A0A653B4C8_ECTOL|nr:conserved protein of unknown function [Pseudomonas oleovorans]
MNSTSPTAWASANRHSPINAASSVAPGRRRPAIWPHAGRKKLHKSFDTMLEGLTILPY